MTSHAKIVSSINNTKGTFSNTTILIIQGCPCGIDCPAGCLDNCSSRYCERSFLVLNTALSKSTPLLMTDSGEVNLNLNFKLGERTEVFRSCSVNFKGDMLIFGGDRQRQQVGELSSLSLEGIYFRRLKLPSLQDQFLNSCF